MINKRMNVNKLYSYIVILVLAIPMCLQAQVGINTLTPLSNTLLHIDALGNNSSNTPSSNEILDDIVITANGNVGVETTNPSVLLDVVCNIQIQDGNEAELKVLASDADGNGTWKYVGEMPSVRGILGNGVTFAVGQTSTSTLIDSDAKITLSPGTWLVLVSIKVELGNYLSTVDPAASLWLRTTFSDNTNYNKVSSDIIGTSWISSNAYPFVPTTLSGFLYLKNAGTTEKTYSYRLFQCSPVGNALSNTTQIIDFGSSSITENSMVGIKIAN